ncbi:leucyl-tRNA ligase [Corynebacterium vitaeruminis DSM 20294]|uniref:Leucyl-tRNA ligase n=1 Tax=Corynebacterium vitaeruminis DSM 20294 TaxID=1224164 RepID=W5Y3V4_9CORY|nr:leucyl-tRNA ligase [Corynebacterium vitaeruminis DSM 20294]
MMSADAAQDAFAERVLADANVQAHVEGKNLVKQIVVPGRMVNLVVK